jgi:hypothetical protein
MPAGLPGSTNAQNLANPSLGLFVIYDLLSGPKGSPFDYDKDFSLSGTPASGNTSTGALSTGIGFGSPPILDASQITAVPGNFDDDYTVGVTKPDGTAGDSTLMYIGGGRETRVPAVTGPMTNVPYTLGHGIGGAGNGGSRDAGAGPAFTGFRIKSVTAAAGVANGAVVETGWVNRSGVALITGNTVFAPASAASVVPSLAEDDAQAQARASTPSSEIDSLFGPTVSRPEDELFAPQTAAEKARDRLFR